ncbi:MAG TPA: methyltransferase domain-containing protein [Thermoplasmata archaeon]|nr:methyltransferase domain-containing protein [Thermoplasmata archaeon]
MSPIRESPPPNPRVGSLSRGSLENDSAERWQRRLEAIEPEFRALLHRIPLQDTPPLPPEWLRWEMLERREVLRRAPIEPRSTVLEVGSGGHAITTVPLAYALRSGGRVLALERRRWGRFSSLVAASGLGERIRPLSGDARRLPLRDRSVELALCVHGLRSLESEENMVRVFRELLRVARGLFLAETLPVARTPAQEAHLRMYGLREELFVARTGRRDDIAYLPLPQLRTLVERAGGTIEEAETVEVDLPHALAVFPRSLIEELPAGLARDDLLRRWDGAEALRQRVGEDHPPVGIIRAAP